MQKTYLPWHWRVMQNFKKNWLVLSNMTWGIWWIFTQPLESPKISLQWAILYKVYEIWAKERSYLSWHWTVMQNLNKPWSYGFKNGTRNWVSFIRAPKVWKLYKAYTVSVRKFQSNYVSWHWRVLQSLNENRLVAWKLT